MLRQRYYADFTLLLPPCRLSPPMRFADVIFQRHFSPH